MKNFLSRLDSDGERWLLLVLYSFIVGVIFIEVMRRFVLLYSSVWGEETARYTFIYLVWIGAASAVRERAHIRIDIITHYLPPRGVALVYLFGDLATLVLACLALYWSIEPVVTSLTYDSVTHGLRISQAWFLAAVPFGFSVVLLRLLQSIRRDIGDIRAGRPPFTGNKLFE